jgi:hypothetical protein
MNLTYFQYLAAHHNSQGEWEADFAGYGTILFQTDEYNQGWNGTNISVDLKSLPSTQVRWEVPEIDFATLTL